MTRAITVADLPESGRFVVVDEMSGRWVFESTDSDKAESVAARMNLRENVATMRAFNFHDDAIQNYIASH